MTPYEEIHQKTFHLLESELPSFLTYHSPLHSAYVLKQAELIAAHENITAEDLILIRIASILHDVGFIRQYKDHEEAGCEIAYSLLQEASFSPDDILKIQGMIMATKIPQMPNNIHEKIVADADLEYLGTDLFPTVSQLLYKELHYLDNQMTQEDFRRIQIDFLSGHHYHTDFCIHHREPVKQMHLAQLRNGE
jgi:uncharacterized protein